MSKSSQFISNCPNVKYLFFPNTITDINQLDENLLNGSNINYLVFTGISNIDSIQNRLNNTNCLGLSQNCTIETSNGEMYSYAVASGSITSLGTFDIDKKFAILKTIKEVKKPSLRLGQMSIFSQSHIEYCITNKIPFIIVYHDSKTSASSREFYQNSVEDSDFKKKLKDLKCPIFMLDRKGYTGSSDASWYKTTLKDTITKKMKESGYDSNEIDSFNLTDYFCCISFVYFTNTGIEVSQTTTITSKDVDVFSIFQNGYNNCHFNRFDSKDYDTGDTPDEESINDSGLNTTDLINFITITPWWINSGTTKYSSNFKFSNTLDFRYIASKENTYAFVCSYDQRLPSADATTNCNNVANIFKKYAYTIDILWGDNTYKGMFCEKLEKGLKYKKMLFYEFSHGSPGGITIDHINEGETSLSKETVWNTLNKAKNVIFGIFESCYSASMFKASQLQASNTDNGKQEESMAEYIINKFEERKKNMLKKGLFGSTFEDPMILLWSSAPKNESSYYTGSQPGYQGDMSQAIRNVYADSDNYMLNYKDFFDQVNVEVKTIHSYSYKNYPQSVEYGGSQKQFRIMN